MDNRFDYLDEIAEDLKAGDDRRVGVLSTGEMIYVYLAANKIPPGYTIASAISRLGEEWSNEMVSRHRYN